MKKIVLTGGPCSGKSTALSNLKDTLDQVPEILNNLYNAGYLERIDWQYNGQNVYYMLKNADME